jgi:hypothetical protein
MILLTKAEEILLMQFHEKKGDRTGAEPGETLSADAFSEAERISPGLEFEGALQNLLDKGLLEAAGDKEYRLSQKGHDYLYAGAGHRTGEG